MLLLSLPLNAQEIIFGDGFENTPPMIVSSPETLGETGVLYSYDVDAIDFNGDLLAYYFLLSPSGMEMDAVTGEINWTPEQSGDFPVTVEVSDGQHGFANQSWSIAVVPPDPVDVAPENDPLLTTVFDSTEFLYTGDNPIQTGVEEGTIVPFRVMVIRGNVMTRDGAPLPGATISILNHEEFGQTVSRIDGAFDMVVNGGGHLTINYVANGYLPAQRQLRLPWQDYIIAPDVALVPLDPIVTTIDMNAGAMQMAEGSMESDVDGERHAMVLFPPGTTAELVMPDGSTQAVNSLNVRATEYTVGPNGPAAMPGELPPASGYTYAVELSADEAITVGASRISFNQSLPFYVENFLGFPVGGPVPTGFYDRDKAAWLPSDNGRVIKLISINGGLAEVDTTGDEVVDNGADIGMTDVERQQLASLYTAGQSLWRMLIPHFSPWDANWPFGPPDDAEEPNQSRPLEESSIEEGMCYADGSIIEAQNQTLGESVRVTGTPFTLNYSSERTPARLDHNRLNVSLSGASVPASLKRIDLKINVAGQNHLLTFPPDTDQTTLFTWDNLDAFGRPVQGIQKINGSIGYVFDGVYQNTTGRFGYGGNGIAIEGSRTRREVSLLQRFETSTGNWDARGQGLGGWTLDVHHFYDPVSRTIYMGDGRQRGASSLPRIIDTVVKDNNPDLASLVLPKAMTVGPDGSLYFARLIRHLDENNVETYKDWSIHRLDPNGIETVVAGGGSTGAPDFGDNGPATEVRFFEPIRDLAFGGDGSLYLSDKYTVRKIGLDGIIHRVAGVHSTRGGEGCDAEGVVATETQFCDKVGDGAIMTVSADGTIYLLGFDYDSDVSSTGFLSYIRRIGPDGIGNTIAGASGDCVRHTNFDQPCGDGGPAIDATFLRLQAITAADDGSIYISETCTIRRITPDGMIEKFAGQYSIHRCGNSADVSEGGDAQESRLGVVYGMAAGINGLYVSVGYPYGWVLLIKNDNTISRFAGDSNNRDRLVQTGDTGPALAAIIGLPWTLALAPDNSLYVHSGEGISIRKVGHFLSGVEEASIFIASQDGVELYTFDASGRHLQTLHALTGATLYEFDYDSDGHLSSVIEKTGGTDNVTTIEHDGSGNPTRITGPFGQQTALTVDANGFLASVTNPVGESLSIVSSSGGLITKTTDPRGRISDYGYDDLGRLTSQGDNGGYSQTLVRSSSGSDFGVTRTTGLGRTGTFDVQRSSDDTQQNTNTAPDGSQNSSQFMVQSGAISANSATGMSSTFIEGPDPRFGMQVPIIEFAEVTAPGGLTFTVTGSSDVELSDPTDLLSLIRLGGTATVDGRTTTSTYTAANRSLVMTSPEGRVATLVIDELGRVVSSQFGDLAPVTASYNVLGRLETLTSGTGDAARVTQFSYGTDGFHDSITDSLGRTVSYKRDAAGRITTRTLPGGIDILFHNNAAGELDGITPPGQPEHGFAYTLHGQIASIMPPFVAGTGPTTFGYNADRQLLTITRPGDEEVTFEYDTEGRVQTIELTEGGVTAATYAMNYLVANQIDTITGPGPQTVSYDYQGDLVTGVTWAGVVEGSFELTYDSAFRVSSESINGGTAVTFGYDNDDLLTNAGAFSIERNTANGLAQSASLGMVSNTWGYNIFGAVTEQTVTANGVTVFDVSYTHDKLGRITQKVETIDGVTDTYDYGYDLRGQLTEVQMNSTVIESYTYDDNGNRISATVDSITANATYDAQDRLLTYGSTTYIYTAAGRLAIRTELGNLITDYDYDIVGNLRGVTLPDTTEVSYGLDGPDRRVQRSVDGTITHRFLYDGYLPVAELDVLGNVVNQFIYAGSHVPVYMIRGGMHFRIITDQVGSVRLVINAATGTIIQRLDYDSFGKVLIDTNPGFQPIGFAGGIYDPVTKLVRFGTRDYDPEPGRWMAKDVIGFAGNDINLYRYVNNNPINYVDSLGQDFWDKANGFINTVGEYYAVRNLNAMFLALGPLGAVHLMIYKGLDLFYDFDEPHVGDLLPQPTNYDDYDEGGLYGKCTAIVVDILAPGGLAKVAAVSSKAKKVADAIARNQAWQTALRKGQQQIFKQGRNRPITRSQQVGKGGDKVKSGEAIRVELMRTFGQSPGKGVGGGGVF